MNNKKLNPTLHIILFVAMIILSFITLFPVFYTVFGSFKLTNEILTSGKLLPRSPTLANFIKAWVNINFFQYTLNSVIVCISAVAGTVILSSMTAFVLDRRPALKGNKFIFAMYTASIFISLPVVTIYPIFKIMVDTGLNKSLLGLIVTSMMGGASYIFMIQSYLRGIPKEIDEAAIVDGCGFFRLYVIIIMPVIKPILATVALLHFRSTWNSYLMPSILSVGNDAIKTLTVAIVELKSSGMEATDTGLMLAGSVISIVPMIVVYIFANKNMMSGLTSGAVKG